MDEWDLPCDRHLDYVECKNKSNILYSRSGMSGVYSVTGILVMLNVCTSLIYFIAGRG